MTVRHNTAYAGIWVITVGTKIKSSWLKREAAITKWNEISNRMSRELAENSQFIFL